MIPEPRLATTMCVLAPGDGGVRVLMVRRSAAMRFMPGAWVFPGGVIDPDDDARAPFAVPGVADDHRAWAAAGVREVVEETGIWLCPEPVMVPAADRSAGGDVRRLVERYGPVDGSAVHHLSTWITPTAVPVRFHTRFSVVGVDGAIEGEPDGVEVDEVAWLDPATTVTAGDAGEVALPLPTRHTLAGFAALGSVPAILTAAQAGAPPVIQPRLRLDGDVLVALIPGDQGYDETPELPPDADTLSRVVEVRGADGRPVPELGRPR
jgi:8-oxo-dGTP pyrophosphatase MutT (NUDIX family)